MSSFDIPSVEVQLITGGAGQRIFFWLEKLVWTKFALAPSPLCAAGRR